MEKIMARFTSFNQILSQGSSAEDNESDEDDETQEDKDETNYDEDDDDKSDSKSTFESDSGIKIEKVDLKEPSKLEEEFVDNNYWKVGASDDVDIDALYDELED
mmetsp:Transcript_32815/g.50110  ORF Transcript_32815/g.50110 Transcript_32815/m.50110 type:complete len:104 (-) Transcript_32815:124-435(-)